MAGLASAELVDMCCNAAGPSGHSWHTTPAQTGTESTVGVFCRLHDDIKGEPEPEAARAAANLPGQLQREPDRHSRKRGRSTSPTVSGNDGSLAANSPATALGAAPSNSVPAMQPQLAAAPAQQHTTAPMAAAPSARATSQRQETQVQHSMAAAHAAQRPPCVQQPRHAAVATTAERGARQSLAAQTVAPQQQRQAGGGRQAVPMAPPRAAVAQTVQQPQPGGAKPAQRPHAASNAQQQPAAASAPSSAAQVRLACIESMSLLGDSKALVVSSGSCHSDDDTYHMV